MGYRLRQRQGDDRCEDGEQAEQEGRQAATTPKTHHITPDERAAVIAFAREHQELGHKRLAYAMADAGVAAVRPTTVYGILKEAGLIGR